MGQVQIELRTNRATLLLLKHVGVEVTSLGLKHGELKHDLFKSSYLGGELVLLGLHCRDSFIHVLNSHSEVINLAESQLKRFTEGLVSKLIELLSCLLQRDRLLILLRHKHCLLGLSLSVTSSNKHIFIRLRSFNRLLVGSKQAFLALHATFPLLIFLY